MKVKNIVTTVVFCLLIFGFFVLCLLHKPVEMSESERRPLAQFPEISWQGVASGETIGDFDDYTVDQFPFREAFRKLYTWYRFNVVNIKETNGFAEEDGYIAKVDTELCQPSLDKVINKFSAIYEQLLKDSNGKVYLSIIPDKNYFFSKEYGHLSIDYDKLVTAMRDGLPMMEYIDIFDTLALDDYYKTDTDWSQEKIAETVNRIAAALGCADRISGDYKINTLYPFYGVYHAQSALDLPADTIYYLTNEIIDACTVFDYETNQTFPIYTLEKFESKEPYDIFLGGTKALLRIDNPNATEQKELVVFRDSFGSSLIPLLAEGYSSIYVVDIRYVDSSLLGMMGINFENADTLFLYSTLIINSTPSFKEFGQ